MTDHKHYSHSALKKRLRLLGRHDVNVNFSSLPAPTSHWIYGQLCMLSKEPKVNFTDQDKKTIASAKSGVRNRVVFGSGLGIATWWALLHKQQFLKPAPNAIWPSAFGIALTTLFVLWGYGSGCASATRLINNQAKQSAQLQQIQQQYRA
mmetsp:Transcript_15371/g.23019  ORF Transcript_15371/g.23019 Transcript_15371/m.23019 type:complete len:150 (-) Transcript_15371:13-462(-)